MISAADRQKEILFHTNVLNKLKSIFIFKQLTQIRKIIPKLSFLISHLSPEKPYLQAQIGSKESKALILPGRSPFIADKSTSGSKKRLS